MPFDAIQEVMHRWLEKAGRALVSSIRHVESIIELDLSSYAARRRIARAPDIAQAIQTLFHKSAKVKASVTVRVEYYLVEVIWDMQSTSKEMKFLFLGSGLVYDASNIDLDR